MNSCRREGAAGVSVVVLSVVVVRSRAVEARPAPTEGATRAALSRNSGGWNSWLALKVREGDVVELCADAFGGISGSEDGELSFEVTVIPARTATST